MPWRERSKILRSECSRTARLSFFYLVYLGEEIASSCRSRVAPVFAVPIHVFPSLARCRCRFYLPAGHGAGGPLVLPAADYDRGIFRGEAFDSSLGARHID